MSQTNQRLRAPIVGVATVQIIIHYYMIIIIIYRVFKKYKETNYFLILNFSLSHSHLKFAVRQRKIEYE